MQDCFSSALYLFFKDVDICVFSVKINLYSIKYGCISSHGYVSAKKSPTKWERFVAVISDFFDVGIAISGGGGDDKPIRNERTVMPKHLLEIDIDSWDDVNGGIPTSPYTPFDRKFSKNNKFKDIRHQGKREATEPMEFYSDDKPEEDKPVLKVTTSDQIYEERQKTFMLPVNIDSTSTETEQVEDNDYNRQLELRAKRGEMIFKKDIKKRNK